MNRVIGGALVVALAGGFIARTAVAADADVVAKVNGEPITMAELQKPLLEAYGLKILLFQIQLKLAYQQAKLKGLTVTQSDFDKELERTLKQGFQDAPKEDYPALLQQLLDKKGVSRPEFDMVMQTNAILRKIAEPELKDAITDAKLKEGFNAMYGETAVVRHIQLDTPREAELARQRLASGEKFETVVRTMSRNARTAALDGELPPFSRPTVEWPGAGGKVPNGFKDWAFDAARKPGDISETIAADGAFHILRLDRKVEPKAVKFEDVKDSLKAEMQERLTEQGVAQLRIDLGKMARQVMVIQDPVLKKQFDDKIAEQIKAAEAEKRAREDILKNAKPTTNPLAPKAPAAVTPAPTGTPTPGTPAGGSQASPANAPTGERPPASKSAAPAPGAASDTQPKK